MLKWVKRLLLVVISTLMLGIGLVFALLHLSKPTLDGTRLLTGLKHPVQIERDALGVATVSAEQRIDLARALGFVHAQERFFQMDLLRRVASGELSELFGKVALELDQKHRVHRFRARMPAVIGLLSQPQKDELQAYVDGVNAGLESLAAPPFPYAFLMQKPRAWSMEDSLLVPIAMFFDLQGGDNRRELAFDKMRHTMPPELFQFITQSGTDQDSPMLGDTTPSVAVPSAQSINLTQLEKSLFETAAPVFSIAAPRGSNNFAVAGSLSETGSALVADDMHLGLGVPNIWFRARLKHGRGERSVDVSGVSLPGLPAIVVGSNTKVAWAFTNSYGDWLDFVRVDYKQGSNTDYALINGASATVESFKEPIRIKGSDPFELTVRETVFGPITATDADGHDLALRWTAHDPHALNVNLQQLEHAANLDAALNIAQSAGMPAQNFIVGDRAGRIGWTIAGKIPLRDSTDPQQILSSAELTGSSLQWLDGANYPAIVDPIKARLWSANARVVDGEMLRQIGDGGYEMGARGRQIRDGLLAQEKFSEQTLLDIQLDDRALFLERWRQVLRSTLTQSNLSQSKEPSLEELRNLTQAPLHRASIEAVDYRLVRAFRLNVHERVMNALAAPTRARWPEFALPNLPQAEGVVWELIRARPAHLLDPRFGSWEDLLLESAVRVARELGDKPGGLKARTWGERNTAAIQHPLSKALPFLSRFLDMPQEPLPGDSNMPRVQASDFGASERMVVSPGFESRGIMHMPGGQSGHPLSPFYGAGHDDWAKGKASSFLPMATKHTLTLQAVKAN